ncbi:MAG: hypothetical protein H8D22_08410 [Candidatus Cloacimonetes bacterium]|nr:hypothetical protein [Candidatus Cloacimonadota bacterium]
MYKNNFNKLTQKRIEIYRKMTPQQRIEEAIQLTDLTYEVMKEGIRNQHPNLDEAAIQKLVLERMEICRKKGF